MDKAIEKLDIYALKKIILESKEFKYVCISILLFTICLLIISPPGRILNFDEIDYFNASKKGFLVNAFDSSSVTVVDAITDGDRTNQGTVYVVTRNVDQLYATRENIVSPVLAQGEKFGHAVAISENSEWIAVGAPGGRGKSVRGREEELRGQGSRGACQGSLRGRFAVGVGVGSCSERARGGGGICPGGAGGQPGRGCQSRCGARKGPRGPLSHGGQVGPQGLVGQHLGDIGTSVGDVRALDRGQEAITSSWGRSHERSEEGE